MKSERGANDKTKKKTARIMKSERGANDRG